MGKFKDLTGQRFGKLTVIEQLSDYYTKGGNKKHRWRCKCDCGRDSNVIHYTSDLTLGKSHQCKQCLREITAKITSERMKKYNEYDLSGNYGIGYTSKGEEFWFDLESYDLIKDYCWYKHRKYFEAKLCDKDNKDKHIFLHKLIMNDLNNEYDIDHIKTENKFDNRKLNLRKVCRQQNNSNSTIRRNNTSGITGVRWHSRDNIWESWIRCNYENIYLGRFDNFEDAVKARKEAEEKYFGEYSYDNSQKLYEQRVKELENKGE